MNPYQKQIQNLYLGILNNYPEFEQKEDARLQYDFAAEQWRTLKSVYAQEAYPQKANHPQEPAACTVQSLYAPPLA